MRRTLPLVVSLLLAVPWSARAEGEEEDAEEEAKPKKKSKGESAEPKPEMKFDDVELTPKRKKKSSDKPGSEKGAAARPDQSATDKPELSQRPEDDKPTTGFARHRYGYVIGGGFLVTGLAFAYSAQGEAKRAETIGSAREATQALDNARASAATANVIYGAAAVTLAVALLFEVLPEPVAEKASLTFHF
ncbi:MAG: hypothetical protein H6Q89_5034 [Myxococcaceae bacterium]|nr:hypothetical protein [Myxococcaceae bacterium]